MATIVLRTPNDGTQRYSEKCLLGNRYFTVEFRWNARDSSWGFVISDAAGNVLATKKVVATVPLTIRQIDARMPDGEFIALDTTGKDQDPGLKDLGARVLFTYTDAADFV